jgi:hypothetical protein
MEHDEKGKRPRRISSTGIMGTVGIVVILGLLAGSSLPTPALGASPSLGAFSTPAVVGARLNLTVVYTGGGFTITAGACARPANYTAECNVTFYGSGTYGTAHNLNYSMLGSHSHLGTFYLVNSDPTLPCSGLPTGLPPRSVTFVFWFHVIPTTGTIPAFMKIYYG